MRSTEGLHTGSTGSNLIVFVHVHFFGLLINYKESQTTKSITMAVLDYEYLFVSPEKPALLPGSPRTNGYHVLMSDLPQGGNKQR